MLKFQLRKHATLMLSALFLLVYSLPLNAQNEQGPPTSPNEENQTQNDQERPSPPQEQDEQDRADQSPEQSEKTDRKPEGQDPQAREKGNAALGVMIINRSGLGVRVVDVFSQSGAEEAGLEDGDRIIEVDGKRIESAETLQSIIQQKKPGDKVSVSFIRDGQEESKDIELVTERRSTSRDTSYSRENEFNRRRAYRFSPEARRPNREAPEFGARRDSRNQEPNRREASESRRTGTPGRYHGDEVGAHIHALEQEVARLTAEIQEMRRMLRERPGREKSEESSRR